MECVDTFIRVAVTIPILSVVSGAILLIGEDPIAPRMRIRT